MLKVWLWVGKKKNESILCPQDCHRELKKNWPRPTTQRQAYMDFSSNKDQYIFKVNKLLRKIYSQPHACRYTLTQYMKYLIDTLLTYSLYFEISDKSDNLEDLHRSSSYLHIIHVICSYREQVFQMNAKHQNRKYDVDCCSDSMSHPTPIS